MILTSGDSVRVALLDGHKSSEWANHLGPFHQSSFDNSDSAEHPLVITYAELLVVGT